MKTKMQNSRIKSASFVIRLLKDILQVIKFGIELFSSILSFSIVLLILFFIDYYGNKENSWLVFTGGYDYQNVVPNIANNQNFSKNRNRVCFRIPSY